MKVTTRKGTAILKVEGELTVSRANELKKALLNSLTKSKKIEIDLDEVTAVDLAALQLLCSAHRTADKQGKKLSIKEPSSAAYLEARDKAGFMYSKPCRLVNTEDCLWVGGN